MFSKFFEHPEEAKDSVLRSHLRQKALATLSDEDHEDYEFEINKQKSINKLSKKDEVMFFSDVKVDAGDDFEENVEFNQNDIKTILNKNKFSRASIYYGGEEADIVEQDDDIADDNSTQLIESLRLQRMLYNDLQIAGYENAQNINDYSRQQSILNFFTPSFSECDALVLSCGMLPNDFNYSSEAIKIDFEFIHQSRDCLIETGFNLSFSERAVDLILVNKLLSKLKSESEQIWIPLRDNFVTKKLISGNSVAALSILDSLEEVQNLCSLLEEWLEKRKKGFHLLDKSGLLNKIELGIKTRNKSRPSQKAFFELVGLVLLKHGKKFLPDDVLSLSKKSIGPNEFIQCMKDVEVDLEDGVILTNPDANEYNFDFNNLDSLRPITKEMFLNKGLPSKSAKRSRKERNPRVNLRRKHKKALIRRRSTIPENRKETCLYDGEQSGIRLGVIRSIKY